MRGNFYYPDTRVLRRKFAQTASTERAQALLNSFAFAAMAHVLPWCDPNNKRLRDPLSTAHRNLRGMIRAARHLPPVHISLHELCLAIDGSGSARRSARSALSRAMKDSFGLV